MALEHKQNDQPFVVYAKKARLKSISKVGTKLQLDAV